MRLELNSKLKNLLNETNWSVNRDILYTPDQEQFGILEYWCDASRINKGDCDDFAITKYNKLLKQGVHTDCMGPATCWCYPNKDGYHAVLIVSTDQGDYILDNRYLKIQTVQDLEKAGYVWDYIPKHLKD